MQTLLESRVEAFWVGIQDDEDTPAVTPDKCLRKVGGDMTTNRSDGQEAYSDGGRFASQQDFVDTLVGEGSPVAQAQAGAAGLLAASILGDEEVTEVGTGSGLYDHVAVIGPGGKSLTAWKRVGEQVGPLREKHNNSRVVSLRLESSQGNKVAKATPQLISLDPGELFETDPAVDPDPEDALLHTEGAGRYLIDGEAYVGASSWAAVINDAITPRYGDSVRPHAVGFGVATIGLEQVTIGLDEQALTRYYEQIYGMSTPPAGTKPIASLPGLGTFSADLRKGSQQRVSITGAPTGGDFKLALGSRITGIIPYNATAAQVQTALEGIVGRGRVTCSGGPLPGTAVKVVFTDAQLAMTINTPALTGGSTPAAAITDDGYYRGLKVEIPGVKWAADLAIPGNVEGGPTELALAAAIRQLPGEELITVTTRNGDSAAY